MRLPVLLRGVGTAVLLVFAGTSLATAQWRNSQVFNAASDWNNGAYAIKNVRIVPDRDGGVHGLYVSNQNTIRYRHFDIEDGLGGASTIKSGGLVFNADLAELGDGTVAAVWEDWTSSPRLGYAESVAGAGFSPYSILPTISGGDVKWPNITAQGTGPEGGAVITYYHASTKQQQFLFDSGGGFGPDTYMGSKGNNEYTAQFDTQAYGVDGSVYRFWGEGTGDGNYSIRYRRFDPATETWGSPGSAAANLPKFISRLSAAVADNGKMMVVWDMDNGTWGTTLSEGTWTPPNRYINRAFFGNVAVSPGTDDFYIFNVYAQDFPVVNPVLGGLIDLPLEYPGEDVDFSDTFIPWGYGAFDPSGNAYMVWEHWGGDGSNPVAYITYRPAIPEPDPLPGDLNGDGLVGGADLDIIRANWSQAVTRAEDGDADGDGTVGTADLDIVRANWGATAAAAVPEPGAGILLLVPAWMAASARLRRRDFNRKTRECFIERRNWD